MNNEEEKEEKEDSKEEDQEKKEEKTDDDKKKKAEEKTKEVKEESKENNGEKIEENTEKPAETPKAEDQPKADQPKAEKPVEEPKKAEPKPEPTGKFKELIKDIESLSVIELSELVKTLEDRFGVSAAAPVAVAQAPAGDTDAGADEGKSTFNIELTASGEKKIDAIKAVREVNLDLGLKEAKDIVDGAPKILKENVKKEEAEEIKKKIEASGAKVTLK